MGGNWGLGLGRAWWASAVWSGLGGRLRWAWHGKLLGWRAWKGGQRDQEAHVSHRVRQRVAGSLRAASLLSKCLPTLPQAVPDAL